VILPYTHKAASHVEALAAHYLHKKRPEAIKNLFAILRDASAAIVAGAATVYPTPRPYPELLEVGRFWVHFPPYWIAFRNRKGPIISAVLYDTSDIPSRL
jgi:plasmid stabilization system protein ParE